MGAAKDGKNYRKKREVFTGIFTVFFEPTWRPRSTPLRRRNKRQTKKGLDFKRHLIESVQRREAKLWFGTSRAFLVFHYGTPTTTHGTMRETNEPRQQHQQRQQATEHSRHRINLSTHRRRLRCALDARSARSLDRSWPQPVSYTHLTLPTTPYV